MKANLRYANHNCANVQNANLLGIKWKGCKIENLQIGKRLAQETKARKNYKEYNEKA